MNTERMPSTYRADLKIDKSFTLSRIRPTVFFEVKNLFDRKNLSYLEDEEYYLVTGDPEGAKENKHVWETRRLVRAGLMLTF